jgi:menaquinone-dependent protoporphyrinogen oxidase
MNDRVLVAYGTKHGATKEIAEKVGQALRESGFQVDVVPAEGAGDLGGYGSVVIGSAVYMGQWRKDAKRLLRDNETLLGQVPVWLFSSGPTAEGDPAELLEGWRYPKSLEQTVESIKPRGIAVFGGFNNPEKMTGFDRWVIKRVKASIGDFRDWEAISAWAGEIASSLREDAKVTGSL